MVTKEHEHGWWIPENSRPKSYKFICSECGGIAYDAPTIRAKRTLPKRCGLKYCPHCGKPMQDRTDKNP